MGCSLAGYEPFSIGSAKPGSASAAGRYHVRMAAGAVFVVRAGLVAALAVLAACSAESSAERSSPTSGPLAAAPPPSAAVAPDVTDPPVAATNQSPVAPVPGRYVETFDGAPAAPTPWRPTDWDVTIHSRDVATFDSLEPMLAQHGSDCAGPPEVHELETYEGAVFQCRDHVMTAINAGGYAMIYLTPPRMVDFTDGEAVISVDISTLRTSIRDWWDVWITPYGDNLQLPLDLGSDVDATGAPRRSVQVVLGTENQLKAVITDDFEPIEFPGWPEQNVTGDVFTGYETFLEPDAARRDTVEVVISKTSLKVGMPAYDFWWIDTDIPELDWSRGVVQLGHHSYNPTKDCGPETAAAFPPADACEPNTWHWDNLVIDPAVPFTIIGSAIRAASAATPEVSLLAPAPEEAHLRFAGIGRPIELRFDGGAWQPAQLQTTGRETKEEHFASYWHPLPPGTRTVEFRGADWWGGPWLVRDVTAWSTTPSADPVG